MTKRKREADDTVLVELTADLRVDGEWKRRGARLRFPRAEADDLVATNWARIISEAA